MFLCLYYRLCKIYEIINLTENLFLIFSLLLIGFSLTFKDFGGITAKIIHQPTLNWDVTNIFTFMNMLVYFYNNKKKLWPWEKLRTVEVSLDNNIIMYPIFIYSLILTQLLTPLFACAASNFILTTFPLLNLTF